MQRARIGVDGNAGYALLGEDIQSGECEFVVVPKEHCSQRALQFAAKKALEKLRNRLGLPNLCWYALDDYWGDNYEPRIV